MRIRTKQTTAQRIVGGAIYWLLLPLWGPCRAACWCVEALFDYADSRIADRYTDHVEAP